MYLRGLLKAERYYMEILKNIVENSKNYETKIAVKVTKIQNPLKLRGDLSLGPPRQVLVTLTRRVTGKKHGTRTHSI